MITKCLSKKAKRFIDEGSMIVAINGVAVEGMGHETIRDALSEATSKPPLNLTLRIKIGNIRQNKGVSERMGILKVKVVSGLELKHPATHCVVEMNGMERSTKHIERDQMPEWHQTLTFRGFKPSANQTAKVTVYDHSGLHSALFADKVIGTAEFEVPVHFETLKDHNLELKSPTTGHLHGVILLRSVIVENARMMPDDYDMDSTGKMPANSKRKAMNLRVQKPRGNAPKMKGHRSAQQSAQHHQNGGKSGNVSVQNGNGRNHHVHHRNEHRNVNGHRSAGNGVRPNGMNGQRMRAQTVPVAPADPVLTPPPYAIHTASAPSMAEEPEIGIEIKNWFETQVHFNRNDKMKYCQLLIDNGFENLLSLKYLGESQLREIGVVKLGHMHMILAAIKEL